MPNGRIAEVFLDICTQRDYLRRDGARPAINAEQITANIKHLMALARWLHVPTLSCVDVARPSEVRGVPLPYCVLGTPGQQKISYSLLPQRIFIDSDNCLCVPLDVLEAYQQAILVKRHRDPFTNPKLDRLLTEMPTRRFWVFGVSLESSIRLAVLGLLLRHRFVALVRDACGYWNVNEAEMTLRQLAAKGCQILTTREVVEAKLAAAAHPPGNGKGSGNGHNGHRHNGQSRGPGDSAAPRSHGRNGDSASAGGDRLSVA